MAWIIVIALILVIGGILFTICNGIDISGGSLGGGGTSMMNGWLMIEEKVNAFSRPVQYEISSSAPMLTKQRGLTVGSSKDNDIVLAGDTISSTHAKINIDRNGTLWISDKGSLNGIFEADDRNSRKDMVSILHGEDKTLYFADHKVDFYWVDPNTYSNHKGKTRMMRKTAMAGSSWKSRRKRSSWR